MVKPICGLLIPCPSQRFEGVPKHLPQPLVFFSKQA